MVHEMRKVTMVRDVLLIMEGLFLWKEVLFYKTGSSAPLLGMMRLSQASTYRVN